MSEAHKSSSQFCHLLAAYELKLLDEQDTHRFENHLPDCDQCLDELYAWAPEVAEMTSNPGAFSPANQSFRSHLSRIFVTGPGRLLVPVAMAAALAVVMLMPQTSSHPFKDLVVMDAPAYSRIQVRAGQQSPGRNAFDQGMHHYQQKEYGLAAERLGLAVSLMADEPMDSANSSTFRENARFYLGVSRLLDGQVAAAIPTLEKASQSPSLPIKQKSTWYLAQAELLLDRPDAALIVLNKLNNSPVYREPAGNLIKKIDSLKTQ